MYILPFDRLIVLLVTDLRHTFIQEIARGVGEEAANQGYDLLLLTCLDPGRQPGVLTSVLHSRVAGVLAVLGETADRESAGAGADERWVALTSAFPFVLIDHQSVGDDRVASVSATNRRGAYEATHYLADLGHSRIAIITGPLQVMNSRERLEGYREALQERGLAVDPSWIRLGDYCRKDAYRQTHELLALDDRPTAIFASNDEQAYGVIDAAQDVGLMVPQDLSVVGFDDISLPRGPYPWLTSVRQPLYDMGRVAAQMVFSMIRGVPVEPRRREVPTSLVIRGSAWTPCSVSPYDNRQSFL